VNVIRFTDGVIDAIHEHLALVPPEQGAALMGFSDIVSLAVIDSFGAYSSVYWDISAELGAAVQELELHRAGTLMGTVHSHPRGIVNPSSTDIQSTTTTLRLNPHLPSLVVAIVTEGVPEGRGHLAIGSTHRMSLHTVRLVDDAPVVEVAQGAVLPISSALADAGVLFDSAVTVRDWRRDRSHVSELLPRVMGVSGSDSLVIPIGDEPRTAIAIPGRFPLAGPLVLGFAAHDGESTGPAGIEILESPWDPKRSPRRQLRSLALRHRRSPTHATFARAVPIVGDLTAATVVVAGLGSVGSRIAEDLARAGVGTLVLIDPERVEDANLSRSVYTLDDLGERKTVALARRLRSINPAIVVRTAAKGIGELDIPDTIAGAQLVVGATDDMREQLLLAHHGYAAGIPMVCCALYQRARAGELIISMPGANSACVACSLGNGKSINQFRPESDYGVKGRLVAEPGLGPSIQLVASMASLLALGVLAGPDSTLAPLIASAIATARTLAVVATQPRWEYFPELFEGIGHQLAPQSVWVTVQRDPECVVCGAEAGRVAPPDGQFTRGLADLISEQRDPIV
jgi:molybdopterin/thiamine biosynthesis adenylyltransferase